VRTKNGVEGSGEEPQGRSPKGTPRAFGFRMPPEWAHHRATWLTWPRGEGISFPGKEKKMIAFWADLVQLLSSGELVRVNCFSREQRKSVQELLQARGLALGRRVLLYESPAYEPWCRDHGPIFVQNGRETAIVDWGYDAWGKKYPPYSLDDLVPQRAAFFLGMRCFEPGIVLEGGAIDTNGEGTFLVGSRCLLDPVRNPGMTRERMEWALREYLGAERVIWLEAEIVGDDTDGHVDEIARFIDRSTIVVARTQDPEDPNYTALEENFERLQAEAARGAERLRLVALPMPGAIYEGETRLPASYANFYFSNGALLFPAFGDPMDAVAGEIFGELVRDRPTVPVPARDLVWGFGGLHCITQQEPE